MKSAVGGNIDTLEAQRPYWSQSTYGSLPLNELNLAPKVAVKVVAISIPPDLYYCPWIQRINDVGFRTIATLTDNFVLTDYSILPIEFIFD